MTMIFLLELSALFTCARRPVCVGRLMCVGRPVEKSRKDSQESYFRRKTIILILWKNTAKYFWYKGFSRMIVKGRIKKQWLWFYSERDIYIAHVRVCRPVEKSRKDSHEHFFVWKTMIHTVENRERNTPRQRNGPKGISVLGVAFFSKRSAAL